MNDITLAKTVSNLDQLHEYAKSSSPSIRLAVVENPHVTQEILVLLARANEMDVRIAASKKLSPENRATIDAARAELAPQRTVKIFMSSLPMSHSRAVTADFGLVMGTSSKIAWGFDKQSDRLSGAMDAALLDLETEAIKKGANAVLGINVAVNSSSGGSASVLGVSEGIIVIGTAVVLQSAEPLNH